MDIEKSAATVFREKLFELQDLKYRDFHSALMPNIDREKIIGVRVPALRKLASEYKGTKAADEFIEALPHEYYEENNLHGLFICFIKDYRETISALDRFLPYVDNWATCDLISPKVFKKHADELITKIKEWTASKDTYTIRFGIEMLMSFYLDENFKPEYLSVAADVVSSEYYVNMMRAWFFATALAKQYEATVPFIAERKLDEWTHRKTIQKAVESYRVTDERKEYLKSFRS